MTEPEGPRQDRPDGLVDRSDAGQSPSATPPEPTGRRRKAPRVAPDGRERSPGEAWNIVGTLLAGMAFWGFVGWLVDRLTHLDHVFLPIGVVLGLAAALYLVIYQALRR